MPTDATAPLPDLSRLIPDLPPVEVIEQQLDAVEREMTSLREEVEQLRKRDRTVNFHMQRIDEELRMAARLQQDFLPKSMPRFGTVGFNALWRPAGYVSGDIYDIFRLDENHVGFYIADAVGHGVPAALLTMFIKHSLVTKEISNQTYRLLDPGETLARLNDALAGQNLATGTFCTACYAVLDLQTQVMELASAGHPTPMLLRGDDPPRPIPVEGSLLGIFEGEQYRTRTIQLGAGDRVLLYTDGVEVAFSPDSETADPYRFSEELFKRRHLSGEALIYEIARHLDFEVGSLNPRDDLTLLVMGIGGEETV
ncbi:PP2C family protein-serine/threonine phosphatase [Humisphaera borealis]|uniref:SpoIIE family protein phosphatase n=1 Tax=Humisphaera borealis TaxID=2807512 RepID=A0A7M2WUC8_9BACT|nr:PP2C family protein-serine/threonine phosphatase [Humisphaera borealis]QOV88772.1 SpoIIE family protein phosphatase [Humisphaera borealis]